MDVQSITLDRNEARELYRDYKMHLHYSTPIDDEIRRAYQLIAQGRLVIKALESIRVAGLNAQGWPKLAIAGATAKECFFRLNGEHGVATFKNGQWPRLKRDAITLDPGFGRQPWFNPQRAWEDRAAQAIVPIIPVHLRPRRALENYYILWEAEWQRIVPKDPYLLRRIGKGDMWLVVAMWDLTEVERAALATRLNG